MDALDFDDVKAEKASAMQRYNRLRGLAKLFRMAELCVALLLISWTFARLPFAVRISGEYFRKLFHVIVSPLFVFVLCNAIIVSLIAKSGRFSGHNQSSAGDVEAELYEEIIKNSSERARSEPKSETRSRATDEEEEEEVVYHDKQIISEVSATASEDEAGFGTDSDPDSDHPRVYRRTQSERFERECSERPLRRAETEKFRNVAKSGEEFPPEKACLEDKLSDEEFNRTVEDFIAKQLRFRREESLAVVLPNHC